MTTGTSVLTPTAAPRPVDVAADTERDSYQRGLVATYQASLARAAGDARRIDAAGAMALADLLGDLDGLLRHVVNAHLSKRYPGWLNQDMFEDCLAEARAACVTALPSYDPARSKFRSWVLGSRGGVATEAIKAAARAHAGHDWLTQGEEIVSRYAHAVRSDLRAGGVEPSSSQIRDETLARCHAWALERVDEQWARDGRALPGSDDPAWAAAVAEREELASAKLRKDGTMKALLGDLDELLAATDVTVLLDTATLDPTVLSANIAASDPTGDAVTGADLGPLGQVAVLGMSAADKEAVWSHLAGDGSSPTREVGQDGQTGASQRKGRARIEALMETSRALLTSPHAHFAALSPSVGLQFDIVEAAAPDPRARLVAAVRAAGLHA